MPVAGFDKLPNTGYFLPDSYGTEDEVPRSPPEVSNEGWEEDFVSGNAWWPFVIRREGYGRSTARSYLTV